MSRLQELDGELWALAALLALAVLGAVAGSLPLSLLGALGAVSAATLYLWQRHCLSAVSHSQELSSAHADFGEEVTLQVELVNDKPLPVTWLQVEDPVPSGLVFPGATVTESERCGPALVSVIALLPYQRVRRRLAVRCVERGLHSFGPALLRSGDPLGLRVRESLSGESQQLLVYPKRFALDPGALASRALLGELRATRGPLEDPSNAVGVRPYRPGDPLRSIDWRASARSPGLQVRDPQRSATLATALLVDFRVPLRSRRAEARSQAELVISIAASIFTELVEGRQAVGLFASGVVDGSPIAFPPRRAADQLSLVLEALARVPAVDRVPFSGVLASRVGTLRSGTSVVVIASDFPAATLLVLAELRRRHHLSAVWVHGPLGDPPPEDQVDLLLRVDHEESWRDRETLDLAP